MRVLGKVHEGTGAVVLQVKPPFVAPASHMGASASLGCSTSDSVPCWYIWECSGGQSVFLHPCTHVGNQEEAPSSWL